MNVRRLAGKIVLSITAFLACAILLPSAAAPKGIKGPLPFRIQGDITIVVDSSTGLGDLTDVGECTYWGRYSNSGVVRFDPNLVIIGGEGYCVAANNRDVGHWIVKSGYEYPNETFFDGGTGRFEGQSGSFLMEPTPFEITGPDEDGYLTITFSYVGKGTITLTK